MKYENYFKDMFESIPDYRKLVLLVFLVKNDVDLLKEYGFLNINRLNEEYKEIFIEQNEEFLDHFENQKDSIIEKILNK